MAMRFIPIILMFAGSLQAQDCYRLNNTVTLTGLFLGSTLDHRAVGLSPYGFPRHPFYMCSPQTDPEWRMYLGNLPPALGTVIFAVAGDPSIRQSDWPTGVYVRVTGEIELDKNTGRLTMNIFHVENVDSQIKALIADWKRECAAWQDEQIHKVENDSRYSSNMQRLPGPSAQLSGFSQQCGIYFLLNLPDGSGHSVTIMRPAK